MRAARVVAVGGEDADLSVLSEALIAGGHEALCRLAIGEAVDALAKRVVDLLVLDVTLPGIDVARVLRAAIGSDARRARMPVLVMGPASALDRIADCLGHGAEDYLLTPLNAAPLALVRRRITLALQRSWLRDATVRMRIARTAEAAPAGDGLQRHTDAFARFVPREFIEHLGKTSLTDVGLGDHVEREMTVFFSDIRDFTTLSESLTPQQNFDFLNSYLRHVTPLIRARNGFVDKYIGDAIMALFPRRASDALETALELQRKVVTYNEGRKRAGYEPIKIGIGLHYGSLILGTIGEDERMQTTVIADAVNVASRLEGLTKSYGISLLVSSSVIEQLSDEERTARRLRPLGAVRAKGKMRSVEIFEVYDNDPQDLLQHKDATAEPWAQAMEQFRVGKFLTAGRVFARIAGLHSGDTPAAHFRDSCTLSAVRDRGRERWDGAERIEVK